MDLPGLGIQDAIVVPGKGGKCSAFSESNTRVKDLWCHERSTLQWITTFWLQEMWGLCKLHLLWYLMVLSSFLFLAFHNI